jgi:1-deoxy-D-xylulose-5-phosphate reductoisomerase
VMGRKISVDSATMMNKGLEVIEAHWLFGAPAAQIEVVIHPQSVIHSMVSYVDGSVLAQLGNPDMRTPIAHALAFPERIESGVAQLDLTTIGTLQFEKPDFARFPCLALAFEALEAGGTAPALLNAANEVAVQAFLDSRIGFRDIDRVIARVMIDIEHGAASSIDAVMAQDALARAAAGAIVAGIAR